MQPAQPYRGPSRAHRRELQALLGDHPINCDDKSLTDLLLVETMDLDAAIDAKRLVKFAFAGITAREERVLRLRHGFGDSEGDTYREIASQLGITVERGRQIELAAYRKIRRRLKNSKLLTSAEMERLRKKPAAARVGRLGLPTNPPAQVAELRGSKEVYALPPLVVAFAGPADDPHGLAATFQRAPSTPAGQSGTNLRSLISRLWNWVPGGRVRNTGLYSHRSLTDRRY